MQKVKLYALNSIYLASLKQRYKRFLSVLSESEKCQQRYLMGLLSRNRDCSYGRAFSFEKITGIDDFRQRVPIITYDDIKNLVEQIKAGQKKVLTSSPVIMFEKSSGSVSATKYIPFTAEFLVEIHNSTAAWIYDIYKNRPSLLGRTAYWSLSPKLGTAEVTRGGVRIGMADDTRYFSRLEQLLMRKVFAVSPDISNLDADNFRLETSLQLLADENLGLISVWNPTFLTLLLEFMQNNRDILLAQLATRQGHRKISRSRFLTIENLLNAGPKINFMDVWPGLVLLSCWTESSASMFLRQVRRMLPGLEIQAKGLFMTEGIITAPLFGLKAPVLCIGSHFYEFLPADDPEGKETLLPAELQPARKYIPIITTGGGLYRYNTNDIVRVEGFHGKVPLLSFVSRVNNVVDICGEKLNESFVSNVLDDLNKKFSINPIFEMLAPIVNRQLHYALFIEIDSRLQKRNQIEQYLDRLLCKNYHYQHCRALKQLGSVKLHHVEQALATYEKVLNADRNQKPGDIKNVHLDSSLAWADQFTPKNREPR